MQIEWKGKVKCSFITRKSRLILKDSEPLTVSRLELKAALIASRIKMILVNKIPIKFNKIKLWTDSKVVLNFLEYFHSYFDNYGLHRKNKTKANIADWSLYSSKF